MTGGMQAGRMKLLPTVVNSAKLQPINSNLSFKVNGVLLCRNPNSLKELSAVGRGWNGDVGGDRR